MRIFRVILILFGLLCFLGAVQAQNVYRLERSGSPERVSPHQEIPELRYTDVLAYDIHLTLTGLSAPLQGTVRILFESKIQSLERLDLHLDGMQIEKIASRMGTHSFQRNGQLFTIFLPQALARGDTLSISVSYSGRPANDGFGGYLQNDGFVFTVGEGIYTQPPSMTRYWLPCKDVPWDKALVTLRITVPESFYAAAIGVLQAVEEDTANGHKTFHYVENYPVASYLIAFAVAPYILHRDFYSSSPGDTLPLIYYVTEALAEPAQIDFATVPQMLAVFEARFGPYPFEQYAMALAPMQGAMEHQTMTTFSSYLITGDRRYEAIVAHELAHQWWGDWVTLSDWSEIWLNEGFASYSEIIYLETKWNSRQIQAYLRQKAEAYFREAERQGDFTVINPEFMWGATVYEKGAWVLHMLRNQVGEENFWEILGRYGRRHAYGNANVEEFVAVVNEVTGQDWNWFFRQWLYTPGYPRLRLEWQAKEIGYDGTRVTVSISQIQKSGYRFRFPLELAFVTPVDTILRTIQIDQMETVFADTLRYPPLTLIADPHTRLLFKPFYFEGVVPRKTLLGQNFPNPFLRSTKTPVTHIQFLVYRDRVPITLTLYDLHGRRIRSFARKVYFAGKHEVKWDGRDEQGKIVPAGIYFCEMKTPYTRAVKRIVFFSKK